MATQRRYIQQQNKITAKDTDEIRNEVRKYIQSQVRKENTTDPEQEETEEEQPNNPQPQPITTHTLEEAESQEPEEEDKQTKPNATEEDKSEALNRIIEQILNNLKEITMDENMQRTPLKKINNNGKAKDLIKQGNEAVREITRNNLDEYRSATAINNLTYATALTIQNILIPETKRKRTKPEKVIHHGKNESKAELQY